MLKTGSDTKQPLVPPAVVVFAVLISLGVLAYIFVLKYLPNNQMAAPPDPARPLVLLNGVPIEGRAIISGETILLSLDLVKAHIDPAIWWDSETQSVVVTTKHRVIKMRTDSLTAYVNRRPLDLKVPASLKDEVVYVPMDVLSPFYRIRVQYHEQSLVFTIDDPSRSFDTAIVSVKNAVLRSGASIKEPIVKRLIEGETLRVFPGTEGWYTGVTESGHYGYVDMRHVARGQPAMPQAEPEPAYEPWRPPGKINLTWEHVVKNNPDVSTIPDMPGLNVISPTWFSMADSNGTIINKADASYVKWAHSRGYKVWALVDNGFDPRRTSPVLRSLEKRETVIQQILAYASLYNLDGINIDFENVFYEDSEYLTQFIRELAPLCREQGLVLSIDVTVKSTSRNWSMVYDRRALGQIVDYMAVMAYDQHPSGSRTSGSVGSLPWVEAGLLGVLEEVPAEKLLLGVPFYTRLWREETKNGVFTVTSRALGMQQVEETLSANNAAIQWNQELGQHFAVYRDGPAQMKVWLEDERSMALRVALVKKYSLAGIASWRRGFEKPAIWNVIYEGLR